MSTVEVEACRVAGLVGKIEYALSLMKSSHAAIVLRDGLSMYATEGKCPDCFKTGGHGAFCKFRGVDI